MSSGFHSRVSPLGPGRGEEGGCKVALGSEDSSSCLKALKADVVYSVEEFLDS